MGASTLQIFVIADNHGVPMSVNAVKPNMKQH